MKSQKMKTTFVIVCVIIIISGIVSLLSPDDKEETKENVSAQATEAVVTPADKEATNLEETVSETPPTEETITETPSTEETVSETPQTEEVEHRTGDEIIGISDKDFNDLHAVYYESVNNDVTGNWRLAVISENVDIQDYIFSYYQKYFKSDDEVHGIVNLGRNVTTRINKSGNWLLVSEYDYVDGEEHDAKILYSGTPLHSYIVYTDNGDIESAED